MQSASKGRHSNQRLRSLTFPNGTQLLNSDADKLSATTASAANLSTLGTVAFDRIRKTVKVPLAAVDTAGGCFAWQNPEAGSILIVGITLRVTTIATSAGTVSAGTTAVNATTLSANLIDTVDVHSATGLFNNIEEHGTLGKSKQELAAGKWITGSKASGALAGLIGSAFIEYIVI